MAAQRQIHAAAVVGMALLFGMAFTSIDQDPATASAPRVIEVMAKRFAFEPAQVEGVWLLRMRRRRPPLPPTAGNRAAAASPEPAPEAETQLLPKFPDDPRGEPRS